MNRRTVLGLAGASISASLAGCLDGVRDHFGVQGVIPIEVQSDADDPHNVHIEARERGTDRESYEQSFTIRPEETVGPPNLDGTDQNLRVAKIVDDTEADVEAVTVPDDTHLVLITILEDGVTVDVLEDVDEEDETDDVGGPGNETDDADDDPDGNDDTDDGTGDGDD